MFKRLTSRIKLKTIWFITYLSVLLLPFIVCSYNYIETYNIIKKEINNNNLILLKQIQNILDVTITDFNKISLSLQLNERSKALSYANKPLEYHQYYLLYQLEQELASFYIANNIISDIQVHFKKTDIVVTRNTTLPRDLLHHIDNNALSYQDWEKIYSGLKNTSYKLFSKNELSSAVLCRNLIYYNSGTVLSSVAIIFNEEYLTRLIKNNLTDRNANICILDEQNKVILSTDNNLTNNLDFSILPDSTNPFTSMDRNNTAQVITLMKSKASPWKYLYIVPNSIYNEKLYHVSRVIVINLGLCIIIGLFIIYVYSKMNYRPVKKIMSFMEQVESPQILKNNEYNIILSTLKSNHTELNQVLQNSIMSRILKREIELPNTTILNNLNIHFQNDSFIVIIIQINNPGTILHDDGIYPNNSLLKNSICNVLDELASGTYHYKSYFVDCDVVHILSNRSNEMPYEARIRDLLSKAICFFSDVYQVTLTAGYSQEVFGMEKLPFAYSQAREACEYVRFFENNAICFYGDIDDTSPQNDTFTYDSNQLVNLVMSGNMNEVKNFLAESFNNILSSKKSVYEVKYFIYFYHRTSLRLKTKLMQKFGSNYPKSIDNIRHILTNPSLKKIAESIDDTYSSVTGFISEGLHRSNDLIHDICQYIDNSYTDCNMNVTTIASHFNFTPSYLSKKFKEGMGTGIIDYVYKVRIMHAKQLIQEADLKVSDIALIVGFTDSNAFIRIFKKIEGITPGIFKDMIV